SGLLTSTLCLHVSLRPLTPHDPTLTSPLSLHAALPISHLPVSSAGAGFWHASGPARQTHRLPVLYNRRAKANLFGTLQRLARMTQHLDWRETLAALIAENSISSGDATFDHGNRGAAEVLAERLDG